MVILKPETFVSRTNKKLANNQFTDFIPAPNPNAPVVALVADAFEGMFTSFLGGNFFLTVLFATSMQTMWGLVNTFQVGVLSVLF